MDQPAGSPSFRTFLLIFAALMAFLLAVTAAATRYGMGRYGTPAEEPASQGASLTRGGDPATVETPDSSDSYSDGY